MTETVLPCIDSRWIAQTFAFRRQLTTPARLGESWLLPGHAYGSVLRDSQGQWRMWYLNDPLYTQYYAVSDDGLNWTQPDLGLGLHTPDNTPLPPNAFMLAPQKDDQDRWLACNIGPEGFCVLDNQTTPHPAARARFTALYLSQQQDADEDARHGLFIAHSDDGIHWRSDDHNPVIDGWHDTNNMFFYDERIKRYVLYGRPDACIASVTRANRLIGRCESDDLIHWTPYRTVLDADDLDADPVDVVDEAAIRAGETIDAAQRAAIWRQVTEGAHTDDRALIRGRNRQFYGINVFPYAGGYLAIAQLYDVPTGHMWLELLHSHNGIDWRRESPRRPWLDCDPNAWDYPMQVTFSGPPIEVDDRIFIYYGAVAKNHHARRTPGSENRPLRTIGARQLTRDRWAAYIAGGRDAELLTQPLTVTTDITLNAQTADDGELRVQLCDTTGKPLPGYELQQCRPIIGDGVRLPVHWQDTTAKRLPHEIRLRIVTHNATLFAIEGATRNQDD